MQRDEVISILESLVHGQTPVVIEALTTAANVLRKHTRPESAGRKWTDEEDALLCREFDEGISVGELARKHERTRNAITLRLMKLGRLDAGTAAVKGRGARVAQ